MTEKRKSTPRRPAQPQNARPKRRASGTQAKQTARPGESQYREIVEMLPHGVQENDREGRIIYSNPAHHRILGYDEGELIGKYIWDVQPGDAEKAALRSYLETLLREQPALVPYVTQSRRKDGSLVDLQIDWNYQRGTRGTVTGFLSIITDITGRKQIEQALLIKDRALESSVNAVAMSDLAGRLTYVNPSFLNMWVYERDSEVLGRSVTDFWQSREAPAAVIEALLREGRWQGELVARRRDGSAFPAELSASMVRDAHGIPVAMMASFIDITERRQVEARFRHVNRLYAFLSQVNQAIVRLKEREALFQEICAVAVEYGKFRMAWIGLIDADSGAVRPAVHAGHEEGYLQRLAITTAEQPAGRGPTGSAVREGKLVICEDIESDPCMLPWRGEALKRGYRSSAAVPFKLRDKVIGTLNLYAAETGFFTGEERKLLEEIGIDISYALDAVEEEQDRRRIEEALRRSEARYRELVENAPIWVWETDHSVRHIYTNRFVTICLGYEPDEFLRCDIFDLIHPDDREAVAETARRAMTDRTGWTGLVIRWRHKDGSWRYIESRGAPTLDAERAVIGLHGVDQDVTERIVTVDALRDSEEKFRNLVEIASDWIWEVDESGAYTYSSPKVTDLLGYAPEEIMGRKPFDLMPPDEAMRVSRLFLRAVGSRNPLSLLENVNLHKDGHAVIIETSCVPLFSEDGTFRGYRGIDRDITERKRAEERLAESERKYRNLFDTATDAIFILDHYGNFLDVNKAAYERLGYTREEMLSLHIGQVDTPDHSEKVHKRMAEIRDRGVAVFEAAHRKKDGSVMPVEVNARLLDHEGRKVYFSVIRDITERKKAEQRNLEMERRLLHAQKLESLGVLAGGIAHDFNNLLMAVLGNLDMALVKLSPVSSARENIQQALHATHRSAELTRQMLAYSGKGAFVIRPVDVSDLVEENAHLLKASIPKNVVLKINLQRPLPAVEADPAQLQQVVMNLITNGSEAIGDAPGVITLSTGSADFDEAYLRRSRTDDIPPAGTFVYLEVADTGCGMTDEAQQRLFDPFFTTKAMGRGLGMSAILGIMRGHRGAIMVDSAPGRGSSLRVLLPVASAAAEAAPQAGPAAAASSITLDAALRGTVLVVDDEEIVRNVSREMLSACGLTVLTAGEGDEALEILRKEGQGIDCVILDLSMPKKDGITVCREMLKIRPDAKIILSSGYHDQEIIRRGSQEGLAGFIPKPYTLENMIAVLIPVLKSGT